MKTDQELKEQDDWRIVDCVDVFPCGKMDEYTKFKHVIALRKATLSCEKICNEKTCMPLKDRYSRIIKRCTPIFVGEKKDYIKKIRKDKLDKLNML